MLDALELQTQLLRVPIGTARVPDLDVPTFWQIVNQTPEVVRPSYVTMAYLGLRVGEYPAASGYRPASGDETGAHPRHQDGGLRGNPARRRRDAGVGAAPRSEPAGVQVAAGVLGARPGGGRRRRRAAP